MNWHGTVINAGVSGDTTAGGLRRLDWILLSPVDIAVIALGANDGLRGLPVSTTRDNLLEIISKIRSKYPAAIIILTGMQMPSTMGEPFATDFKTIFPEIAEKSKSIFVPFLLEGVAGESNLNQADGIHPNRAGQEIVADNVWKLLLPLINSFQR